VPTGSILNKINDRGFTFDPEHEIDENVFLFLICLDETCLLSPPTSKTLLNSYLIPDYPSTQTSSTCHTTQHDFPRVKICLHPRILPHK
jgi:hypothetical protein